MAICVRDLPGDLLGPRIQPVLAVASLGNEMIQAKGEIMDVAEAKKLVNALANGADPVTGEILPAESPYNEPKVIRALFVAANSLNGKVQRKSTEEKMEDNLAAGRPRNAGLPWTDELRTELAKKFRDGQTLQDLAQQFERTSGAILAELTRQGLIEPRGVHENH